MKRHGNTTLIALAGMGLVAVGMICATAVYLFAPQGGGPSPEKSGVDAVLLAKAEKAIAGDDTGLGDEYLCGMFQATAKLLEVDGFPDRTTLHSYLRNSAEGWKYATDLELAPGELFADPYEWLETGGPLSPEDKRRAQQATRDVIEALEKAGK